MRKEKNTPAYMQVARDIAGRIAAGEIREGERFSGRSLMSSQYNVSPETIRRALGLLAEMDVVSMRQNVGAEVKSRERAALYVDQYGEAVGMRLLREELSRLMAERSLRRNNQHPLRTHRLQQAAGQRHVIHREQRRTHPFHRRDERRTRKRRTRGKSRRSLQRHNRPILRHALRVFTGQRPPLHGYGLDMAYRSASSADRLASEISRHISGWLPAMRVKSRKPAAAQSNS